MRPQSSLRPRFRADSLIGLLLSFLILAGFAFGQSTVDVAWDACPEPDIAGYEVFFGTVSGIYTATLDNGLSTAATLSGLNPGVTYFCAVRAYDTSSRFSGFSEEISFVAPVAPPPETITIVRPPVNVAEISIERASGDELVDGFTTLPFGNSLIGTTSASETL